MDVPTGFHEAPIPEEDINFDDPTKSAPLAVLSSSVAVAVITVAARPVYADGTVLDWVRYLASHYGIDLQHVLIRNVGKGEGHPGVTAFGVQFQDGVRINLMLVAFEDGGRFVTAHGLCPAELWPSYGNALAAAVESITLERPQGSTHAVDHPEQRSEVFAQSRARALEQVKSGGKSGGKTGGGSDGEAGAGDDPSRTEPEPSRPPALGPMQEAIDEARRYLAADAFDDAEQAVLSVDSTIRGSVKIAALYEEHLRGLVAGGGGHRDAARLERVFWRALSWAQSCYPEPHTECEAEAYEAGRERDRAGLIEVLGYEPDQPGGR